MPDTGSSSDTRDVTTSELMRALVLVRLDIEKVNQKFDKIPTLGDIEYLKQRVTDLENWQTWALRLGLPAIAGVIINLTNTLTSLG